MRLVLLVFGDDYTNYAQAYFAILSFLRFHDDLHVSVVTDSPDYFNRLEGLLDLHVVTRENLREWRGAADFFWRIKCKAIELVIHKYPRDDIFYIDSDTFLAARIDHLRERLQAGHTIMHLNEGRLNTHRDKTSRNMWRHLQGHAFGGIEVTAATCMWNAGVVGIPSGKSERVISAVMQVCDEICLTKARRRLIEQFAFSLVLAHDRSLLSCDKWIGHYWGNKPEWNHAISSMMLKSFLKHRSPAEDIQKLKEFNFASIAITRKQRSLKKRIATFVDMLIKEKQIDYFSRGD